ncbi:SDR family oxidoreductase [Pusillimonas sp. SM2304]|uniref:SDR family NAD(P)-dependent oxidoreductase n=1 Tax=Pusillimonas sp. SM2304 TaxID=3073241 RepID=UPI0028759425|nr:SDR family oxidoreductase [Pusillimonas sp. SM2304]MDS1139005.1 SDR family oxidoreductase [Pusillimonas sp. SM2304]
MVGATGALGAIICRQLVASGAVVVASGRSLDKLKALQSDLSAESVDIAQVDVRLDSAINVVIQGIVAAHGRIDALVNTTSVSRFADFLELDDEAWQEILDSKLMAYVRTCRAAIPYMIKQGQGDIVNISGRSARQPLPTHLPGGCANAAVNLLSKGLADRFYDDNIRVNVVAPGPIESERFSAIESSHHQNAAASARPALTRKIGEPSDIAEAVLWLLSSRSRQLTGVILPVDGGSTVCV